MDIFPECISVYMPVYMLCTCVMPYDSQMRASDSMGLELQTTVSHRVDAKTQIQVLWKSSQ